MCDWSHADDYLCGVCEILTCRRMDETYLIGADGERNSIDVFRIIFAVMSRNLNNFDWVSNRPEHDRCYAVDVSKLHYELG